MKKITLILLSIVLSLGLMACGNKTKTDVKTNSASKVSTQTSANETEEENLSTSNFDKELIDGLIKESDYISRLRLQTSTAEGVNATFIRDYRGDLSKIDITIPKTLSPGKEYIVFYKDDQNGDVVPTEREGVFIELNGDKDTNLTYVEKKFGTTNSK
ncbi:hypothetical protein KQI68_06200 [Peptoniphilus sp. MSJ-1]|uniref:Lipoprotein n=1 Tax=Peptoniphilus ovalis TaxID=2841503 RepID=A0ABS6FGZ7_9FIRM|nr:hypothetical protein [Peptoniphilus ovalis]MBU5669430.1 hypothetical protein [Peptoniphilus ovalis]